MAMGRWTGATRVAGWSRPERGTARASPGVFNQDHWVVTVRSYRGLCLCHANRAHGSMCTVLKRNPGKPPGKCPNCARSDLKLFFSEKINLPGFRFQNITCRFLCVCVCLHGHCSFAKAFHMQTFIHDEKPGRSPNHWDERWTSHKEWLVYLGVSVKVICTEPTILQHHLEHCKRNWTFT